ncbi:MAG: hypothetical protein K2R93_12285 [Gemmatimonadaceae bacterium]|nr:hypothetical protein [Gemmatimonadaceae bacterium]
MNRRLHAKWPVITTGKNGRPLTHPRAEWIADPSAFDVPAFEREHCFAPPRRWRFDYAWPRCKVALEVDGASGSYGRHSRPGGMRADHEKLNTAAVLGWCVLRVLAGEETRLATLDLLHRALRRPQ